MTHSSETPNRKRNTIIGTGAGVLGGAAIGLMMTIPSFTSAATEDPVDDAPVESLQDDTDPGAVTDERPEPGVRLRETLGDLVPDTISSDQADAVAEHLMENRPERGDREARGHGPGRRGGPGFDGEVVGELLGLDADELREQLRAGNSIADIAGDQGVAVDTIVDAIVTEIEGHLDLAVEDGRLTEAEAAERLDGAAEHVTDMVNGEVGPRQGRPGPGADTSDASA